MLRVRQLTFGNADTRDVGGRKLNVLDQELGGIILVSSKIISICTITMKPWHTFIISICNIFYLFCVQINEVLSLL